MQRLSILVLTAFLASTGLADRAVAQADASAPRIVWEVKNRFRLFREEKDFLLQVEAMRGRSVLEAEQVLARQSEGRGWARNTVNRLCIDPAGRIADQCVRDGTSESFLAPAEYSIGVRLAGLPVNSQTCVWRFDDGEVAHDASGNCRDEVRLRIRQGRTTRAEVAIAAADGTVTRADMDILVRDLLIVGLGDSVAAGEGNPDRPIALADEGFCFRQFMALTRSDYFRPGRAGFKGDKSCDAARGAPEVSQEWDRLSARWMNAACHRSLYSYQLRTALALAVENPRFAVTFVPLACTGATIETGVLNTQNPRELICGDRACPRSVPAQLVQLQALLAAARARDPARQVDLILLTVGANDIDFSGLVADVIIEEGWARALFRRGGVLGTVQESQNLLDRKLPADFVRLRTALKPFTGGDLSRVLYISYPHPALEADGGPCPGGRGGFDVHPAFGANEERLNTSAAFVQGRFLPRIKALATCTQGAICNSERERMTFVDAHQSAFHGHGVCARADSDPAFDNECFSPAGKSFTTSLVEGATSPLACDRPASEFRAYASRARWFRTANDSYFAAMTYPRGVSPAMQPSDIHDATWGVLSAVYGGAIHPTAEGHAAMADAALEEARRVLMLVPSAGVTAAPLPAPAAGDPENNR